MLIKPKNNFAKKQRGVGLVEILVTVLLMSLGFVVAAKMQMQSMRFSQNAYFQSQAYFLTADMIDRMRSNVEGVLAGDYEDAETSAAATNPGCLNSFCTAAQLARQDIYDWSAQLHGQGSDASFVPALPSSTNFTAIGTITLLDPADAGVYEVKMTWAEVIDGVEEESNVTMNFTTETNNQ